MMLALLQAIFLIALGVGAALTANLLFGWRQRRRVQAYREGVVYLPWCASAGTVRPGRRI